MGYSKPPYYLTAYGLAVRQGFKGTLDEWLASLHGDGVELRYLGEKLQWRKIKGAEDPDPEEGWQDVLDVAGTREAIFRKALDEANRAEGSRKRAEELVGSTVSYKAQTLSVEEQGQVRENIGLIPYFAVDADGLLSLKSEYRGIFPALLEDVAGLDYGVSDNGIGQAGSRNSELPRHLVIPNKVNGVTVTSIAPGAFAGNSAIESIVLPMRVTAIPAYCFIYCRNLKEVHANGGLTFIDACGLHATGIETVDFPGVTSVGESAFALSPRIKKISLPVLVEMGSGAFHGCMCLQSVDIGRLTAVPDFAFYRCGELQEVKSTLGITSVGIMAFTATPKLRTVDLSAEADSIQAYAFLESGFEYDWSTLSGCVFGTGATAELINPTDIWSDLTIKECENPVPTLLSQAYEGWAARQIGESGKVYQKGCVLFSFIHAYCGLTGQQLNSVEEFENIATSFSAGILDEFYTSSKFLPTIGEAFGLTVERYNIETGEDLQRIYDALADGKYVAATVPDLNVLEQLDTDPSNDYNLLGGHEALIYGVRADGRLLIADSSWQDPENAANGNRYALRFEHILHTPIIVNGDEVKSGTAYYIISKENAAMKEVNKKLDTLLAQVNSGFRIATGTEWAVDGSRLTFPLSEQPKFLVWRATEDTQNRIRSIAEAEADTMKYFTFGGVINFVTDFDLVSKTNTYNYNSTIFSFLYVNATYGAIPAGKDANQGWDEDGKAWTSVLNLLLEFDNGDGTTTPAEYEWTAYYWDE